MVYMRCTLTRAATHSGFQRNYIMQRRDRLVAAVYDDADGRGIIQQVLLHILYIIHNITHMHAWQCVCQTLLHYVACISIMRNCKS
jgi:hypothetical protein